MAIIRGLILAIFMFFMTQQICKADLVEVDNLYLEAEKMFNSNRRSFFPENETPRYNLNLGFDMTDGLGILYSKTKVSSTVGDSQFRYVALDSEVGINFTFDAQLYYRHYSGHLLDYVDQTQRFPQENVIGVRFNLIGR